jgi:hypothetical protein
METIFDWGMNIKKFKKKKDRNVIIFLPGGRKYKKKVQQYSLMNVMWTKSVSAAVLKAGDKYPLIKCGKYWTIDMNGMIHKPEDLDSIEPKRT